MSHGGPIGGECDCPLKPTNAKGKRHSECCFHDEPGITVCSCGAGENYDPDQTDPPESWTRLGLTPQQWEYRNV